MEADDQIHPYFCLDGQPTDARPEVVSDLASTMIDSIAVKSRRCTGSEVTSAGFTLCLRMIKAGLSQGVNGENFRGAVEELWKALPPVKVDG